MNKVLIPTGGLNHDDDHGTMPEGDYIESFNQLYSEERDGQGNSIKKMKGFSTTGEAFTFPFQVIGTVIPLEALPDGQSNSIFYLCRDNLYGFIIQYSITTDAYTIAVPRYEIGSHTESVQRKNLSKIGDMLFWNYAENNMPCSWLLGRPQNNATIVPREFISMIKKAPSTSLDLTINYNEANSNRVFTDNDYQITYRIVYDSGERSVLGQPFKLYKARPDVESLTIKNIMTKDLYIEAFEFYARKGNNGVWYRIATRETNANFNWNGEFNEVLDDVAGSTPFHSIPLETKAMEISNNRVFLANNLYDLDNDRVSGASVVVLETGDYQVASSAIRTNPFLYLTNKTFWSLTPEVGNMNDSTDDDWVTVFADNSSYYVGVCFYDEYMRTPGVAFKTLFRTGKQKAPYLPEVEIRKTTTTNFPTWAKYFSLCVSDNLDIDSFYEGYTNYIFFQLEANRQTYFEKRITNENIANVKFLVLDISQMLNADHIYTYQEGDVCTFNIRKTTAVFNEYIPRESRTLKVKGQDGQFIFLEFNGGEMEGTADRLVFPLEDFIIYSPRDKTENIIFYPQGKLHPISLFSDTTPIVFSHDPLRINRVDRFIGDCVFKTFELKKYSRSPLVIKNLESLSETIFGKSSYTVDPFTIDGSGFYLPIDEIYLNNDGGSISGGDQFDLESTYDTGRITVSFVVELTLPTPVNNSFSFFSRIRSNKIDEKSDLFKRTITTTTDELGILRLGVSISKAFVAGDLINSDGINILLQILPQSGGNVAGCKLIVSGLTVTIEDERNPKTGYEFDSDVGTSHPYNYALRAMNLKDNLSWTRDKSFGVLEQPESPVKRRTNIIQHGGTYIEDLLINNISNATIFDRGDVPFNNGPINALVRTNKNQEDGSVLLAICEDETESVYINETVLTNAGGSGAGLALTRTVISDTRTLKGSFGTTHPGSVVQRRGNVYFWDDLEKAVVRYSANGLFPISDIKMRSFFSQKSGEAVGYFDPFYNCYFIYFKNDGTNYSIMFKEGEDRWKGMIQMRPKVASFFDNRLYTADDSPIPVRKSGSATYCAFGASGTASRASVKFVVATPIVIIPERIVIKYNSDIIDYNRSNQIKQNLIKLIITNENGQQTTIYEDMFILEKGTIYAHILRDELSSGGLIEGDIVEGSIHQVELIIDNTRSNEQISILAVSLTHSQSNGHNI